MSDSVPCNGCTACCRYELILLRPDHGDRVGDYQTVPVTDPMTGKPGHALAQRPDGACIYLGSDGCTIHGRAPALCRVFDCRRWFLEFTNGQRRAMSKASATTAAVVRAGRERLASLDGATP